MSESIKIALLQMCSTDSVAQNLAIIERSLAQAQSLDVQFVQLPENFAQMPRTSSERHIEFDNEGPVQDFLREKSQYYGLAIIAGSLPIIERKGDKPFARCLVFDGQGKRIAHYDKLHLYDVELAGGEHYRYQAGSKSTLDSAVVEVWGVKLGLSICYDLRFPEMYRTLTAAGAQIICVPSAFTYNTGRAHWQALLRARAIENQVFVAAAAQVGTHANGRQTWGHSLLIDPWGEITEQKKHKPGLLVGEIDLTKLDSLRKTFPVLMHRRLI